MLWLWRAAELALITPYIVRVIMRMRHLHAIPLWSCLDDIERDRDNWEKMHGDWRCINDCSDYALESVDVERNKIALMADLKPVAR